MGYRTNSGRNLIKKWKIPVPKDNAFYREDGRFFMVLNKFPGALCDSKGYILFETKEDYFNCPFLTVKQRTNVPKGISSIHEYLLKIKV